MAAEFYVVLVVAVMPFFVCACCNHLLVSGRVHCFGCGAGNLLTANNFHLFLA